VPALVRFFHADGNEEDGYADFEDELDAQEGEDSGFRGAILNTNSPRNNSNNTSGGASNNTSNPNSSVVLDVNGFFEVFDPDGQPISKPNSQLTASNTNSRREGGNDAENDSDEAEVGGGYFDAWDRFFAHVNSPIGSVQRAMLNSNPRQSSNLPDSINVNTQVINEPISLNGKAKHSVTKDDKVDEKRLSNVKPKVRIVQVTCGGFHTAAISDKFQLYSWGYGEFGQLGSDWREPESERRSVNDEGPTTEAITIESILNLDSPEVNSANPTSEAKEINSDLASDGVKIVVIEDAEDATPTSTPPPFASSVTPPPSLSTTFPATRPFDSARTTLLDSISSSSSSSSGVPLVPPTAFAPSTAPPSIPCAIVSTSLLSSSLPPKDIYQLRPQPLSLPGKVMFASVGMWHTMVIVRCEASFCRTFSSYD
jgi:hypothetical protein